ncbi:EAL domain-containing protein [Sneathiella marina]|uniref:EAL domain-containing protein n=1 Tax=Sneathiella marina TaxID=2950108 RepID=A0ABY4W7T8_9PROT|nr:EAL domain-containing protein [Sneathiella marina]USG62911.1 EAL domain-containing protein [Sneathiella marina]
MSTLKVNLKTTDNSQDKSNPLNGEFAPKVLIVGATSFEAVPEYNPLDAFLYDDKNVDFFQAENEAEGLQFLVAQDDIAVLLVDVSRENKLSGISFVQKIRQEIENKTIRIILFGGLTGYLQDLNVLRQYDINDYLDISNLTVPQLFSSLTIALQSYERIKADQSSRQSLQTILDVTKELYGVRSVKEFCLTILTQLQLIHAETEHCFFCIPDDKSGDLVLAAGKGRYEDLIRKKVVDVVDEHLLSVIQEASHSGINEHSREISVLPLLRNGIFKGAVVLHTVRGATVIEKRQIDLICANVTLGLENADMFEEIKRLAFNDSLTGLDNRAKFRSDVQTFIEEKARPSKSQFIVVQFVLDYLPELNIALGHEAGDDLLQFVSEQLALLFPNAISLARTSGDGFGLCIPYEAGRGLQQIPKTIHKLFERGPAGRVNLPHVTPRIGLAIYPEDADNAAMLWRSTNISLATLSGKGGTYFRYYNKEIAGEINSRVMLNNALKIGIGREDLSLDYQPQVELASGKMIGVEALLRWERENGKFVSPDEFIPIAETSGLIAPISEWVLREACRQRKTWLDMGKTDFKVAVNLSLSVFQDDDFVDLVRNILAETECPANLLELEITESVIMEDPEQALQNFLKIGALGVGFSIDDFGTGYSSLSYLRRLPVSVLKIDKAFIDGMTVNVDDAAITRTVISLGRNLGLKVLAEGVETEEQVAFLKNAGCHQAQGFFFSRPVGEEAILPLIEKYS